MSIAYKQTSLFNLFFELNERVNFSKYIWIYDKSIYMKPIEVLTYIFIGLNILPLIKLVLTSLFYFFRILILFFFSIYTKDSLLLLRTIKNFPSRLLTSNFFLYKSRLLIQIIILSYVFLCISNLVYLHIFVINGNVYFDDYSFSSKLTFLFRDSLLFFFEVLFILYYILNDQNYVLFRLTLSGLGIKTLLALMTTFLHLLINFILSFFIFKFNLNTDDLLRPYHTFKYVFFIGLYGKALFKTIKTKRILYNWTSFLNFKANHFKNPILKLEFKMISCQSSILPVVKYYSFHQNENVHFNSKSKYFSVFYIRLVLSVMLALNFLLIACNTYFWLVRIELYDNTIAINVFAIGKKTYLSLVSVILFCLFNKIEYKEIYLSD